MDEFIVQLITRLDTSNAITDLNKLKGQLESKNINLKTVLDTSASKQELQNFAKQIQTALNQASSGKLNIDTSKILSSINQVIRDVNNATSRANKIQLSMDNGYYDTQILTYETSLKKLGLTSQEVSEKMKSVSASYGELKNSITGDNIISDDVIVKAKTLKNEMSKLDNVVKQIKLKDSLQADDLQVEQTIIRLNNQLQKNGKYTKDAKAKIREMIAELEKGNVASARLKQINVEAKELHSNMVAINKSGQGFLDRIGSKINSLGAYLSAATIMSKVFSSVRNGVSDIRELDTALVDLKKTTTMTNSELEDFYYKSNDVAKQMGVTTKSIIEQAAAWSRLGYSTSEQATQMAKYSSMFATISPGMNLDESTDGLVSIMKAFKIGTEDVNEVIDGIMSKVNIIGNTRALNNSDIVDFLRRSSSAMAEANNTLEDTIALGTAMVEITRDAAGAGQVLKTVSMRIRGYDEDTEEFIGGVEELSGKIADLTKTASTPGGISLFTDEAKTEFKSTRQLFEEIAEIYNQLTDKNQAELLEALAGKRNGQAVAAILNNFDAVTDSLDSMANSAGNAEAEMAIVMDSVEHKANKFKETTTGIAQNLFQREDMKHVLDGANSLIGIFDKLTEKLGLFKTIGFGAGLFAGFKNAGRVKCNPSQGICLL